uniref:Uncharacterized protein n=1 Tax=Physcomitrium patens TaxID=3218 RepID=A0A2K1JKD1_PHYPA|nr:hypothetical protein PHYPA_016842 [Physcomitrium patens]
MTIQNILFDRVDAGIGWLPLIFPGPKPLQLTVNCNFGMLSGSNRLLDLAGVRYRDEGDLFDC